MMKIEAVRKISEVQGGYDANKKELLKMLYTSLQPKTKETFFEPVLVAFGTKSIDFIEYINETECKILFANTIINELDPAKETAPLYIWLQQFAASLTEQDQQYQIIQKLIAKRIPTDSEAIQLLKPLYDWIVDVLQKMPNSSTIKIALCGSLLYIPIPAEVKARRLLEPVYRWLFDTNNAPFTEKVFQQITLDKILKKPIPSDPGARELLLPVYNWIEKIIPIQDCYFIGNYLQPIIQQPFTDTYSQKLLKPVCDVLISKIKRCEDLKVKTSITEKIVAIPIPGDNVARQFIKQLYDWMITVSFTDAATIQNIITKLLRKKVPADEEGQKLVGPLYSWATKLLAALDSDKVSAIIEEIELISSSSQLQQSFKETLLALKVKK